MNKRFFPFAQWWPEFKRPGVVRADVFAGLTGAVVVLPQGIAYAMLAGMPPHYGLYAAMVPCLIAALFGSSRLMMTGPADAISLTTMALIAPLALPGSNEYVALVLTLTLLVGILQIVLALVKAGKWVDLIPHSVILGFTFGAAILIMNSQVGQLLGIGLAKNLSVYKTWMTAAESIWQQQWHPENLTIILLTLLMIRGWRRFNRYIPAMLVSIVVASVVVFISERYWPDFLGINYVEPVPSAFPPFSLPSLSLESLRSLFGPALIMVLLASTEAMSIGRALALKSKDRFDANQEFLGQGLANLSGAFFSSYPVSGSFNRSGVNLAAGAQTPLSGVMATVFLILILLFIAPLAEYLPYLVISASLLAVAWKLIDFKQMRHENHSGPREWVPMVITAIATLTIALEWAILLGIFVALFIQRFYPRSKP